MILVSPDPFPPLRVGKGSAMPDQVVVRNGKSLNYGRLKNAGSCPKLSSAHVRSLNFQASTPTLYVKNKMAEASLLNEKNSFSAIVGCFF